MSIIAAKKCCCPDPGAGCPATPCPDDSAIIRVGCTGGRQLATKLVMGGSIVGPYMTGTSLSPVQPPFPYAGGGSPVYPRSVGQQRITLALSQPIVPPDGARGNANFLSLYAWTGFTKHFEVGSETYDFNGTIGLGVVGTYESTDALHPEHPYINYSFGYPQPQYHVTVEGVALTTRRIDYTVYAQPGLGPGGVGGVNLTIGDLTQSQLWRTWGAQPMWHYNASWDDGRRVNNGPGPVHYAYGEVPANAAAYATPVPTPSTSRSWTGACTGASVTDSLIEGNGGTSTGTFTYGFVPINGSDGVSEVEYGLGHCPCAVQIGGTLYAWARHDTGALINPLSPPLLDPRVFDPETGEWTEPGNTSPAYAQRAATLSLRLIRYAPPACGYPSGQYGPADAAGTLTVGEEEDETVYVVTSVDGLRRTGPRLWRLTGTISGVEQADGEGGNNTGDAEFEIHFTTTGECSTTIDETEQFLQPHGWAEYDPTLLSPRTVTPAIPDWGTFTANALTVTASESLEGEPVCSPCLTMEGDSMLAESIVQSVLEEAEA